MGLGCNGNCSGTCELRPKLWKSVKNTKLAILKSFPSITKLSKYSNLNRNSQHFALAVNVHLTDYQTIKLCLLFDVVRQFLLLKSNQAPAVDHFTILPYRLIFHFLVAVAWDETRLFQSLVIWTKVTRWDWPLWLAILCSSWFKWPSRLFCFVSKWWQGNGQKMFDCWCLSPSWILCTQTRSY